eukprot:CAMPEP_0116907620 /NCGR_PEP_ID=MMETSP0467-20121206/13212_1 /TAXON_ID=283647 /ORGANISM="Mesodinium pulex, Strain SPMC105" /LENGTH=126 /DNA_ID=CAMNT_0004582669 /DNA_START=1020 /DNA_END=1400 /DNA_ORIENTATION=-
MPLKVRDINLDSNRSKIGRPSSYKSTRERERDSVDKENPKERREIREREKLEKQKQQQKQQNQMMFPENEGYEDLMCSIKDVLKKDGSNTVEEQGDENADQRTFQNFLSPEGKRIEFEGLSESDSM